MSKKRGSKGRAVVTGASSGIGEAFARRLAHDGYDLTLVARRRDLLEQLAEDLTRQYGIVADALAADLTDHAALKRVEKHVAGHEDLELLVNNAGLGTAAKFADADIDRIESEIRLNVVALVRLTRAALTGMVARNRGAIIQISSMAAFQPNPFLASYGATKAYVNSFTEAIADELKDTNVRLLAVCPGPVHTGFGAVAGVDENKTPQFSYVTTDVVVEDSLTALERGQDVCVPGMLPWVMTTATGMLPRRIVRKLTYQIGRRFLE